MVTINFSLLFWLKKSKKPDAVPHYIFLRITVNGKRAKHSIQRKWEASMWNEAAGRCIGNKEDAKNLNVYIDTLRRKAYEAQQQLIDQREDITAMAIKNHLLGTTNQRTILQVFREQGNTKVQASKKRATASEEKGSGQGNRTPLSGVH